MLNTVGVLVLSKYKMVDGFDGVQDDDAPLFKKSLPAMEILVA